MLKPRPPFWSVENNRAKMGGQWPPFPPENMFSGFFRSIYIGSNNPKIRNATPYSTNDAGKVYPSPCSPSSEDDSIIIERRSLSSVAEDVVIRG